jgi:TonB family protein
LLTSLFDTRARTQAGIGLSGYPQMAALLIAIALGDARAQTAPPPQVGASSPQTAEEIEAADAMKRSRRQAENPYRWIKMHVDAKRKPEIVKVEPAKQRSKPEPVTAEAPRPTPPRLTEPTTTDEVPEAATPTAPANLVKTFTAPAPAPTVAAPASVAAPAAAGPAQTTAANPPIDDTEDDLELKPISTPPPEFPRGLLNSVNNGRVTVIFTVQTDGTVGEATADFSTNRGLTRAALAAVAKWTFQPLASAVTHKVEFHFDQ